MALLALTVAITVAITMATMATTVTPLDMSPLSFDDQYRGCGPAMRAALPALNRSEFQNNFLFAQAWSKAEAVWQNKSSPPSPLSPVSPLSSAQAIAIMAYTMNDLYQEFNNQVRVAGASPQHYRDNFHFKTLHFLLSDALAALGDAQGQRCHFVYWGVKDKLFTANVGDIVRFGRFVLSSFRRSVAQGFGDSTVFQVWTCYSAQIEAFSKCPEQEVLVPPFEKFNVTNVIQRGGKVEIQLDSVGTHSKYNCEWVTGGSGPRAPGHLGGLVLATTALAVATGIL